MRSSASSSSSQPCAAVAHRNDGAEAPPSRNSLTQLSLARLLGIGDADSTGSMTLTLNMSSTSNGKATAAGAAPAAEVELAEHERERAKKRKAPEGPRGRSKAARTSWEPKVKHDARLTEFPEQGLKISAGKLYCRPCAVTLPNIKSSIAHHVATNKHKVKLETFEKQLKADKDLRSELCDYYEANSDERQESEDRTAYPLVVQFLSLLSAVCMCTVVVGLRGAPVPASNS